MAAKRGTREIPEAWRVSILRHIEDWVAETGRERLTGRKLAPLLGISQPTLIHIQNKKGALGLHVLLALRKALRRSIDDLLGLDPADVEMDLGTARRIVDAELDRVASATRAADQPAAKKRAR